jgi:hypothetical protein
MGSPLILNVPLPEPQQSLLVNLVGEKGAVLHSVDDALRLAPRFRVTRPGLAVSRMEPNILPPEF